MYILGLILNMVLVFLAVYANIKGLIRKEDNIYYYGFFILVGITAMLSIIEIIDNI